MIPNSKALNLRFEHLREIAGRRHAARPPLVGSVRVADEQDQLVTRERAYCVAATRGPLASWATKGRKRPTSALTMCRLRSSISYVKERERRVTGAH